MFLFATDRGEDNWLLSTPMATSNPGDTCDPFSEKTEDERVTLGAIDNGLAFPFKHPDNWRTCEIPFQVAL